MDLMKLQKERKRISELSEKDDGKSVTIYGWLYDLRDLGKLRFVLIRDVSGEIQVTGFKDKTDKKVYEVMGKTNRESAVVIKGKVKKSDKAPGGREIIPESFEVLAEADDPLPLDVSDFSKTELPKRIDYRFLDLHRRKVQAIFKIQGTLLQAFREYMIDSGGTEGVFPSIISSSSEGGTELYPLKYFEKNAFLSQSCQLYKQMVACSMEKAFAVFTVWRAEKHNTVRHLNESRQYDFEMAFADEFVVMDELAKVVRYMVSEVLKKNEEELNLLEVKLKVPKTKYLTFAEVEKLMKKEKVGMGKHDLSGEAEKKLGELFPDMIVFVHDWPLAGKPFYIMPKPGKKGEELSAGFDAIYRGMEITSGGQRVHIPELLEERLKANGLKPKDFKSYIDSFRYGAPPHAGWGMGVERLTMTILGLQNIREAVLFPRDRERLTP
ncbi:aspartate--tRNA(Asn) ligase [Candidatus Pacearchaeota archaeon]|nr:aspartate--tRNA(Asn) ligase [Candidatus Pacearchaeota archaeon]|tara:strand:+ start:4681 stop:5994 length:1314 start_codon:yes stop_codon:yes gene_type:complete